MGRPDMQSYISSKLTFVNYCAHYLIEIPALPNHFPNKHTYPFILSRQISFQIVTANVICRCKEESQIRFAMLKYSLLETADSNFLILSASPPPVHESGYRRPCSDLDQTKFSSHSYSVPFRLFLRSMRSYNRNTFPRYL